MPKTILTNKFSPPNPESFKATIRGKMAEKKIRFEDLPGASSASYRRWVQNPGTLTIEHIATLLNSLTIGEYEQEQILISLYKEYSKKER